MKPRRKSVRALSINLRPLMCSLFAGAKTRLLDRVSDLACTKWNIITSQLQIYIETGNTVLFSLSLSLSLLFPLFFLLIEPFFYSPPTSKPHNTPVRPPAQNRLPNPQFLAARPRTSAPRHRPIHPALRLRASPLLPHLPVRPAFPARRNARRGPPIRQHQVGVRGQRILRGRGAGEALLVQAGARWLVRARQRAGPHTLEEGEGPHGRVARSRVQSVGFAAGAPAGC